MTQVRLVHELLTASADRAPDAPALTFEGATLSYAELSRSTRSVTAGLLDLGLGRGERVGIYLEKCKEGVVAKLATSHGGGVFVPINPVLKPRQVEHIVRDCEVSVLITSAARLASLQPALKDCHHLRHVIVLDDARGSTKDPPPGKTPVTEWNALSSHPSGPQRRAIDSDVAAILYTSGSTGRPKGVVLSHRNMVVGAESVARYLGNGAHDTILAALPLSFDAGLSQLTTAFSSGARVVLLNYLLPNDVLKAVVREEVTGLTGVPTLWMQVAQLSWPESTRDHMRYIANTGGKMPRETLGKLRDLLPETEVFLMYGLTEAFRATYLPPEEVDARPDSIGKAIPNSEVLVLRDDGTPCGPGETGELVQRGALVSLGYWNDEERTAERFRPLPAQALGRQREVVVPETVVYSGDLVRLDDDGFLYFVSRRDEMIKTSGYRVSPTEVEELIYASGLVSECAAVGIPDERLGQAIEVVVGPGEGFDEKELLTHCRRVMPAYMVPTSFHVQGEALPKNQNGKIDRKALAAEIQGRRSAVASS